MNVPSMITRKNTSISDNAKDLWDLAQEQTDLSDIDDYSASNNLLSVFLEYCSIIQQFSKSNTTISLWPFLFNSMV